MKVLSILLQLDPTTTLMTKIGDQLFTIALLVSITWILWNRITKIQEKLDKYLEEDRKRMLEVISNNSELMRESSEVMKEVLEELKRHRQ